MTEIRFTLTIAADKNQNDSAVEAFVFVHPNETTNPDSPFFVPADPPRKPDPGVDDTEWLKMWTQGQLSKAINDGIQRKDRTENYVPPARDPDIVERPTGAVRP